MDLEKKLKDFLEKDPEWPKEIPLGTSSGWHKKQKIIVIYGPTASWKTALSIDVAKRLDTEVISTDSRQIFKYMDIGTAKVTKEEMQWVKHHMIDIISPNRDYSVWEYKVEAEKIISKLYNSWKIPILAWWTGLYIDSLIYDFDIPKVQADLKLRAELEKEAREKWNEFVYKKLQEIDPEYALELHPNNVQYVIRAIEVKMLTWKSKTEFRKDKKSKYDVLFLTPYTEDNREELYDRINKRVDIMLEDWLVEEVKKLLKTYNVDDFWLKTIWYEEIVKYLEWKINLEEAKQLIQKNSRNYAKRQLTWFRRYKEI